MTLAGIFDLCQEIELRHAKLYAMLSLQLGKVDERVARFWQQMSAEAWEYYIFVDLGRSLCAKSSALDTPTTPTPDVPAERILHRLNEYEKRIRTEQVTLNQSFEIAIAIEGGESTEIYAALLSTIKSAIYYNNQPHMLNRITQIEKDRQAHVGRLIDATRRLSKDPDLVRRAHRLKHYHQSI